MLTGSENMEKLDVLTVPEVAEFLKSSLSFAHSLIYRGHLKCNRSYRGKKILVKLEDLEFFKKKYREEEIQKLELLTVTECTHFLGVSSYNVMKWIHRGLLKHKLSFNRKQILVELNEIKEFQKTYIPKIGRPMKKKQNGNSPEKKAKGPKKDDTAKNGFKEKKEPKESKPENGIN